MNNGDLQSKKNKSVPSGGSNDRSLGEKATPGRRGTAGKFRGGAGAGRQKSLDPADCRYPRNGGAFELPVRLHAVHAWHARTIPGYPLLEYRVDLFDLRPV